MFRRKKSKTTKTTRQKKTYEVDNVVYDSRPLYEYHLELKGYKKAGLIKSFELPVAGETTRSKFHAYKVKIDNISFDSINESRFYLVCLDKLNKKEIRAFELQKKFTLIPSYKKDGKTIRETCYIADFVLLMADNSVRVIDIKGIETDVFKIKHKLFEFVYKNLKLECFRYVTKDKKWYSLEEIKKEKHNKKLAFSKSKKAIKKKKK